MSETKLSAQITNLADFILHAKYNPEFVPGLVSTELMAKFALVSGPVAKSSEKGEETTTAEIINPKEMLQFIFGMDVLLRAHGSRAERPGRISSAAQTAKSVARRTQNVKRFLVAMYHLLEGIERSRTTEIGPDGEASIASCSTNAEFVEFQKLMKKFETVFESRTIEPQNGTASIVPDRVKNETGEPNTKEYALVDGQIAFLHKQALCGDEKAFENLLLVATQSVSCLTHASQVQCSIAQKYAKRQLVWPALRSGEESLDRKMQEILKKDLLLATDLRASGLSGKFLSALGHNQHRQLAVWLILYMRYLWRCQPDAVAKGEVDLFKAITPYSPSTCQKWWDAAEYILRSTLPAHPEIRESWFPQTREKNKYDWCFYAEIRKGFEQAAPIFLAGH